MKPAETKVEEPVLFIDFQGSSQLKKSIIKKQSTIKSSHEIERLRESREGKPRAVKKV